MKKFSYFNLLTVLKYVWILSVGLILSIIRLEAQSCAFNCEQTILFSNGVMFTDTLRFCSGDSSIVFFNNNCVAEVNNYSFQWEKQTDVNLWTSITGATNDSLTVYSEGRYRLVITGTDCLSYGIITIKFFNKPVVDFSFSPDNNCGNTRVFFTNLSVDPEGGPLTYQWNFGDPNSGANNNSEDANPSHLFIPPTGQGTVTYNTSLLVTNSVGCTDSLIRLVSVGRKPDATLGGDPPVQVISGMPYFVKCTQNAFASLHFYNLSSTADSPQQYTIDWGDNSPTFQATNWVYGINDSISHTYNAGMYELIFIVSTNDCRDTTLYKVFIGSNPTGSISSPGNTQGCTGDSFSFPFANISNNPPGTQYAIFVNDGSDTVRYDQSNVPASFNHLFSTTSCGSGTSNSFTISYRISNPCGETPGSIGGIRISRKAIAKFTISPRDTVCVNSQVSITNTSIGAIVPLSGSGACTPGNFVWEILPATGYSITGNLGNTNGYPAQPDSWSSGSNTLALNFTVPGLYTIKLKIGNNRCGLDSMVRIVCVNPLPMADFTMSRSSLCSGDSITAISTVNSPTCGLNTYLWTIDFQPASGCTTSIADYTFLGGTTDTSANPRIRFDAPGIYAIHLQVFAPNRSCSSILVTHYDTVKSKPVVTLTLPASICSGTSVSPTVTTTCYDENASYFWAFPGGSPATSTSANPGTVTWDTPGTYIVSVNVTNECGTTTRSTTLTVNPKPIADAGPDQFICSGATITIGSPAIAGYTYLWAPFIGLSSIVVSDPEVTLINGSALPVVYSYVVTVSSPSGCQSADTVNVTVYPRPIVSVGPEVAICVGGSSLLTATGADTYSWSPPSGLSSTSGAVVTASPALTTTYTVTGTESSTGCSNIAVVTVTVDPLPVVSAGPDLTVCNQPLPVTLSGTPAGGTWSGPDITSAGIFTPTTTGIFSVEYSFTDISGCSSRDSALITVVQPSIPNAGRDTAVCLNSGDMSLSGMPAGGNWSGTNITPAGIFNPSQAGVFSLLYSYGTGNCLTSDTIEVTVHALPVLTVSPGIALCFGESTLLSVSGADTYNWSPSAGLSSTSGSVVTASPTNSTTYTISGTNMVTGCIADTFVTVTVNTLPVVQAGPDIDICNLPETLTLNGLPAGGNWSGSGITSGGVFTPAATGIFPVVYTFTNTNNCTNTDTTLITVFDSVTAAAAGMDQEKCGNYVSMTANTPVTGIGQWTQISGPTSAVIINPGDPATVINGLAIGTYQFRWTITNGPCSSQDDVLIVIYAGPTTADAGSDQNLCLQTGTILSGNIALTGTGIWSQVSGATAMITSPNTPVTGITGLLPGTYVFRWTISFSNCLPSSDEVTVIVFDSATVSDAGPDQEKCGTTVNMSANTPISGSGNWRQLSGPVVATINNVTNPITSIGGLIPGSYRFIWSISNGNCSSQDTVTVTIFSGPSASDAGPDQEFCYNSNITLHANSPVTGSGNWSFVSGPPGLQFLDPSSAETVVTGLLPGIYILRWTITFSNCTPSTDDVQLTVYGNPIPAQAGPDQEICNSSTLLAADVPVTGTGQWSLVSGPNTPLITNPASATTLISNLIPGVYQFRWTVSNGVCPPTTDQVQITVGALPTTANAGPDQVLCSSGTVTLSGNAPLAGTGTWTQTSGTPVAISNPSLPVTTVTGMTPGVYTFQWTISNSVCPPSQDQVQITNYNAIDNQINTTPQTLCAGQTLQIAGQLPTGGNGIYSYQWQQSPDGITWTDIPGATGQNLSVTVSNSIFIRRVVNSVPCTSNSQPVFITVLAAISNNTLNGNQAICINTTPAPIVGSVPNGGDGTFVYSWEQSTDGGLTWALIAGANTKDYTPGLLTQNTCYRRLVSTNLCTGPQSNTSAPVCITVNPDAQALFTYPVDTACASFAIQIQNTSPANRHLRYDWYADNNFIGSGQSFPGYTIPLPGQSVTIKLVAISAFGCKNDSLSHVFATRPTADPSFTASDTVGCGPLTVNFTNTTTQLSSFSYFWDFGNGITSSQAQPGSVVFNSNPNFRDTIYQVKLFAFTECDTQVFIVPIRVMSKPRAVFTPDRTTGCSPVTVTFNNLSQGIGMSYFWDFGDGATLSTTSPGAVQHTYITGIQRTYPVRLRVTNNCGLDSFLVNIVVTPNTIQLDFAVDGTTVNGCLPHTVRVVNNSAGGSLYQWDFGDGFTYNSVNGVEVINHTYFMAGSFTITMRAINSCSDTTGTEIVNVYRKPIPAFTYTSSTSCIGDNVQFNNLTDTATLYTWNFGDGNFSNLRHPAHFYTNPGVYTVTLYSSLQHATGIVCTDSIKQLITITDRLPGLFQVSDTLGKCIPFTVTFSNQTTAAVNAVWNFGDGNTGIGNTVSHTYTTNGTYLATMTATAPGGCIYTYSKPIEIRGPSGTFLYNVGIVCGQTPVRFESTALNTDSVRYDFGDGQLYTGAPGVIFHTYNQPGIYVPRLQLIAGTGGSCRITLPAGDTIKVDQVKAGFTQAAIRYCDSTIVSFSDTSRAYSGLSAYQWLFGDNSTGTTVHPRHNYSSSGNYQITQIVTSAWGCTDTARLLLPVTVNTTPVAQVNVAANGCLRDSVTFSSNISSPDPVVLTKWVLSNGITNLNPTFTAVFSQTGAYTVTFIAGTVNGCFDTTTTSITIHEIPAISASSDQRICRGQTVQLNASGATNYQWAPLNSLSCFNCPNPVASPTVTTAFVVSTISPFGCKNADTVVVQVVQPFDLTVSPNDTICIGQSTTLTVSGAQVYNWQPSLGLSCNNCQNPIANPSQTTLYRVVGYDIYNCFTDTGYVTVAVGQYPVVSLGPDQVLATGTQLQLNNTITNGPVRTWTWTPTADLSCNNCPLPIANIRNDVCYSLTARNIYGCAGSDTMCVKAFCNDTQVFIPNAFTPDDDGKNDILMVRASGIQLVKKFIIFNRWGEIVFERSNVPPNNPLHGWNGTVKGVKASSDVYVYIAEVICENGTSYSYKGNVTLLK